jgi:hypothetical protein
MKTFSKPKNKPSPLKPVLPLVPDSIPSADGDKGKFLTFELKARAGAPADSTKYKKQVRKFEEDSPQAWLDLVHDVQEIWTQNTINGPTDRAATWRALLKGESLTAFEAAMEDARRDPDPAIAELIDLTAEHVETAVTAVSTTVFPHRALEMQKLWMVRGMFKPYTMTTRKTAAAITRINNCLPYFPNGTAASKFNDAEIVGLLEWSLKPAWRTKFDLAGYVPADHDKARLIFECEAIERNEVVPTEERKETPSRDKKPKNEKSGAGQKKYERGDNRKKSFMCSQCGRNATHATGDCFIIKNREKRDSRSHGEPETGKRKFSNNKFRKEINVLSKTSSKREVLESYAAAIKREQGKLAKRAAKKRKKDVPSDSSESDSDNSAHNLEAPIPRKKASKLKRKKVLFAATDTTEKEEIAFQKKVKTTKSKDRKFLEKVHLLEKKAIEVSSADEGKDSNSSTTDEEKSLTGDEMSE